MLFLISSLHTAGNPRILNQNKSRSRKVSDLHFGSLIKIMNKLFEELITQWNFEESTSISRTSTNGWLKDKVTVSIQTEQYIYKCINLTRYMNLQVNQSSCSGDINTYRTLLKYYITAAVGSFVLVFIELTLLFVIL